MRPAASRGARPAVAAGAGSGVRRSVTVAGVAFLAGIGFHLVVAADAPGKPVTADRTAALGRSSGDLAPGPTRLVDGVPAGFAETPEGATTAAAAFVATGQALIDMDPLAVEEAVRQMAAEATADRQVAQVLDDLGRLREVLRSGTGPVAVHQAAVASRLEKFGEGRSRVAVWNVTVLTREGVAAPQAAWKISTFDLVWERGDWRIGDEVIVPGPAPVLDDSTAPATSRQLAAALEGFTQLTGAPSLRGGRG